MVLKCLIIFWEKKQLFTVNKADYAAKRTEVTVTIDSQISVQFVFDFEEKPSNIILSSILLESVFKERSLSPHVHHFKTICKNHDFFSVQDWQNKKCNTEEKILLPLESVTCKTLLKTNSFAPNAHPLSVSLSVSLSLSISVYLCFSLFLSVSLCLSLSVSLSLLLSLCAYDFLCLCFSVSLFLCLSFSVTLSLYLSTFQSEPFSKRAQV
jgi:hypothetical protein